MIEVPIPHDILKYKAKFIANFTARQFVSLCLGSGVGIFFYITFFRNISGGIYLTALTIIPFYLVGFVTIFGQPFEKIAWNVLYDNFICPAKRCYEVHHPEYEKLIRENSAETLASVDEINKISTNEDNESDNTEGNTDNKKKNKKAKKKQTKPKQTKKKEKEKKVKKSKEFKAIR